MISETEVVMLGAIIGDIIGSPYEFSREGVEENEFDLFTWASEITDDSVMTAAVASALLDGGGDRDLTKDLVIKRMRKYGRFYPNAGYGRRFAEWVCRDEDGPYDSFGNGSAMRVSSVGWLFDSLEEVLEFAEITAAVTHNHPEGIKGAQAVAAAVFLARTGSSKEEIKKYTEEKFGYDLGRTIEEIAVYPQVSTSCQITVPEAITAFLESSDFESAVRKAVSLGGDTDTLAAMAGSVAEAFYGIDEDIVKEGRKRIPHDLLAVVDLFNERVGK